MTHPRLACCSWSLRPADPGELARGVVQAGVRAVQLHLDPIRTGAWSESGTEARLRGAGVRVVSGMMAMEGEDYTTLGSIARTGGVRPDATWPTNERAAHGNAELAARLGLKLVTFHAGFVPHDREDAERRVIVNRTRAVAEAFRARGVRVALETGQETAENLLGFLRDVNEGVPPAWSVGVNFDPANMILYGTGDPLAALRLLLPHVVQVHVKDAVRSARAGEWGSEVPVGTGEVDWAEFFRLVAGQPSIIHYVIEREAGERRVEDVRRAAMLATSVLPAPQGGAGPAALRVGVVGFGFMGQTHVRAYQRAAAGGLAVSLTAVADLSGAAHTGLAGASGNIRTGDAERLFDPEKVRGFSGAHELFSAGMVDAVSLCTPTDTHVELGEAALRAGLHVLLEKPVSVDVAGAEQLMRAEREHGRRVMPAMCMRFWPGWSWLREVIADQRFGRLTSLKLVRLGSRPDWSAFYADNARCGDAITDLHVHDADYLVDVLGMPTRVLSIGTTSHLTSVYQYAAGTGKDVQVTAEGGWLASPGRGFRMRYTAEFEQATAEFDLGASPAVRVTRGGRTEGEALPEGTGYEWQARAFVEWLLAGAAGDPPTTLAEAAAVLRVIECEKRSLQTGGFVEVG